MAILEGFPPSNTINPTTWVFPDNMPQIERDWHRKRTKRMNFPDIHVTWRERKPKKGLSDVLVRS